ncbi:hypothetical protein EYF80_025627 [Liparis tanakae]|uniref:Uncharacterized protein n=1 Tax=Liparis tanakae TaxID=230148 RepID=A0A4Z2HE55_9TELE|nr:hypothetical protein EYF80_025627 [Liparis tanakae]
MEIVNRGRASFSMPVDLPLTQTVTACRSFDTLSIPRRPHHNQINRYKMPDSSKTTLRPSEALGNTLLQGRDSRSSAAECLLESGTLRTHRLARDGEESQCDWGGESTWAQRRTPTHSPPTALSLASGFTSPSLAGGKYCRQSSRRPRSSRLLCCSVSH